MAEQIEDFLFDIIGLLIPGVIVFLTFGLFISTMISWEVFAKGLANINFKDSILMHAILSADRTYDKLEWSKETIFYGITIFLMISYIFGHIVKVFSKFFYAILKVVLDDGLNKFVIFALDNISKTWPWVQFNPPGFIRSLQVWLGKLYKQLLKIVDEVFSFKTIDYVPDNDLIKEKVLELINSRSNINFPKEWYSIYKFSQVMISQEKIKSLAQRFLAKYNFYRSLSFIYFINLLFICYLRYFKCAWLNDGAKQFFPFLLVFAFVSWLTFHEKYKRYWMLCGNEALMSSFYFFIRKNESQAKDKDVSKESPSKAKQNRKRN